MSVVATSVFLLFALIVLGFILGKRNIIHQLLEEYDIETAEDIQDALKDLLGGTIKEMMEAEMDEHLGYEKSERSDNDNYRNQW